MGRRYKGNMDGERYLGDVISKQVHDLDNENYRCRIEKIVKEGSDKPYKSLFKAAFDGFSSCKWCIGVVD